MLKKSVSVDLSKVAIERKHLVQSMTRELEGQAPTKPSSKKRWSIRFVASGLKNAPTRR
jgi:hypothetical protein